MRAVVHDRFGGPEVLRVEEVERPVPTDDEVLVRVHATTVNRTDCGLRSAQPFIVRFFAGLRRPKHRVLGSEFAGEVAAVGAAVTELAVGDRVFGVNSAGLGAHAEYLCIREGAPITRMPDGLSFDDAAAAFDGAIIALSCLRKAGLRSGERIVVYGASGAIGTAAVQLAKHLGAHVTAVCDTRNLAVVGSLGADELIDYTVDDFRTSGTTYDVVFDAVGKQSYRRCRAALADHGRFVTTDLGVGWHVPPLALATRVVGRHRVMLPIPTYSKANVLYVRELLENGSFRPVIDRRYPLDDVVAATTYVETGQKTGNVVLVVA
jgi:NADPH:quinone reductase-like Zn-dependent oxidoreductase